MIKVLLQFIDDTSCSDPSEMYQSIQARKGGGPESEESQPGPSCRVRRHGKKKKKRDSKPSCWQRECLDSSLTFSLSRIHSHPVPVDPIIIPDYNTIVLFQWTL